jgi:hypothetical protein
VHFLYLDLPIGGDPRRLDFWEPVLTRIKNRLSGWKNHFLSFGSRLIDSSQVFTDLSICLHSFIFQSSVRYYLFYWIFFKFIFFGGRGVLGNPLGLVGKLFAYVRSVCRRFWGRVVRGVCDEKGRWWSLVRSWIDFSLVDSQNISDYFLQFNYLSGGLWASVLFCNSFGSYVFKLCGMKWIIDYLEIQSCLYLNCWTRSNSIHIGGCRQRSLI